MSDNSSYPNTTFQAGVNATDTGVFVIIVGIFSAAFTYFRQRRVDVKFALIFDTLGILGVVAGAYLVVVLPSNTTTILMGFPLNLSMATMVRW